MRRAKKGKEIIMKHTSIFHNGTTRNISDFNFDGTVASGYVQGKFVKGEVADYSYNGYTHHRPKNKVSKAKHYLIDLHDTTYGNTVLTMSECARLSRSRLRVRNVHVKRLKDGRCVASGYINGIRVTIEYEGYMENFHTGELNESKPWLGDVRRDLEFKYDEIERELEEVIGRLKTLKEQSSDMVVEAIRALVA